MNKMYLKNKKRKSPKILSFLLIVIIIYLILLKKLNTSKIKINDKELVNILLETTTFTNENTLIKNKIIDLSKSPEAMLYIKRVQQVGNTLSIQNTSDTSKPLVYIYNSHQTEEYSPSTFLEYNVNPTVMMNNYILQDSLRKSNIKSIVEEENIKEILNKNNWNYNYSYKASRILLDKAKEKYSSLKYFVDIHRDSLSHDKTTITINNENYARLIFLIGLENPNYQANLQFTEKINNLINEKYPGLSKGIYKKGGPGVNGVYNQDFSEYTILIEIGGYENTTNEVMNSVLAFSKCFLEVINNVETK